MPYGDAASLIRPYLNPLAGTFIRGKEQADNQDLQERQFGQEVRRYTETTAPYTQELTKQMQFANKKAEEAQRLYQQATGGGMDVSAPSGVSRDDALKGYLGWSPTAQKIKFNLPNVGEVEGTIDQYINTLRADKPEEKRYPVQWNGRTIEATPSEIARLFPSREPDKPPAPIAVWKKDANGNAYMEFVTPRPGLRIDDAMAAGNRPPSAGGSGDPTKSFKLMLMKKYVEGNATPEEMRIIQVDKDPFMAAATRAILANPAVFGQDPAAVDAMIQATRDRMAQSIQQAPSPAATVDSDPLRIRKK